MITQEQIDGIECQVCLDKSFFFIACQSLISTWAREEEAKTLKARASNVSKKGGQSSGQRASELYASSALARWESDRSAISTIVFSALMVEALLNFLARERLTKFRREAIDSLAIPEKLAMLTKLLGSEDLEENDHCIGYVKFLAKQRNRLVHFKPRTFKFGALQRGDEKTFHYGVEQAAKAVTACCLVQITLSQYAGVRGRYDDVIDDTEICKLPLEQLLQRDAANYLRQRNREIEVHKEKNGLAGIRQSLRKQWFWCQSMLG
ncbi:hypothetical protein ACS8YF_12555 [Salinisphaera sp. SWV1]|uniref:hypothetical protein n=1 Tax=Salinisphaera sp. SWV1 TaxID=3454139 RepID=UPI003F82EB30